MPAVEIYLNGTCNWAKVRDPDPKFGNFELDLYMDEDSAKRFEESGATAKVRTNEEGNEYRKLRRPSVRKDKDGEEQPMGPPLVLGPDNEPLPEDVLIGNGSEVTCKVVVYDSAMGKGCRLEAVRVNKLVEYEGVKVNEDGAGVVF